jgi:hypothetical protein
MNPIFVNKRPKSLIKFRNSFEEIQKNRKMFKKVRKNLNISR